MIGGLLLSVFSPIIQQNLAFTKTPDPKPSFNQIFQREFNKRHVTADMQVDEFQTQFSVDCLAEGIETASDCELFITNELQNFVSNGRISPNKLPVKKVSDMPLTTFVWMTFNSISEVSIIEGIFSFAFILFFFWFP